MYPSAISAFVVFALPAHAIVPCDTEETCEERLWRGSRCQNGFCTNPFEGGCLKSMLESEDKGIPWTANADDLGGDIELEAWRRRLLNVPRACNSEDPPAAAERGICSKSASVYPEVRIWSQNWESAFIVSWMMQIIYSELLGVPSTIETGVLNKNLNFYDETNRMDFGKANEYKMLQNAYDAPEGDCSIYNDANKKATGDDDYTPCAHVVMDVWAEHTEYLELREKEVAEVSLFAGTIAHQGWYGEFSLRTNFPFLFSEKLHTLGGGS